MNYAGKTVLVTGASRGIGLAIAGLLGELGARNVIVNSSNTANIEVALEQLLKVGTPAKAAVFDAFSAEAVAENYARMEAEIAPIDAVFSNAGMILRKSPLDMTAEDFRAVQVGNLDCHFYLAQAAVRSMTQRNSPGSIVCTASINSVVGRAELAAYTSAKTGLAGLVRSFAAEFGPAGIRTNAVCPGFVETELTSDLRKRPGMHAQIAQRVPLKRWAEPQDIAGPAAFLGSETAGYVNGHLLVVDGGLTTSFVM